MLKILMILGLFSLNLHAEEKIDYWVDRSTDTGKPVLNSDATLAIIEEDISMTYDSSRGTIFAETTKWPNATLIWDIAPEHKDDTKLKDAILEAIDKIQTVTVLRFKRRTTEKDYLNIIKADGCWSYLGKRGGKQDLSLGKGCEYSYIATHEFFHAAGLLHEHTRSDREKYIKIDHSNLGPDGVSNFSVLRHKTEGPFDFDSIMLYDSFSYYPFVLDPKKPMWTRLDNGLPMSEANKKISFYDIQALKNLYSNVITPPKPNPDAKKCTPVQFEKGRGFENNLFDQLNNAASNVDLKCVSVNAVDEYTIENLPDSLNVWMNAIVETGGTVKKIEVSRSWLRKVFDFIVKVITGRDMAKIREVASNYNAEIYYDKDTTNLIEVKFLKRN